MEVLRLLRNQVEQLYHPVPEIRQNQQFVGQPINIVKYHEEQTQGKAKQQYDTISGHNHDKTYHSQYLQSNFLKSQGKEDMIKHKLLSDRMKQLNYTFEMKPEEAVLTSNSNDQVITDFDRIINDFTTKISAGVVDLTLTDELYKLLRILEAHSYKFSNELCDKYIDYFKQILTVLDDESQISTIIKNKTKDETAVNLMVSISDSSVKILNYIKDLSNKGINVEEKKTALMAYVKGKMFIGIDRSFLKALETTITDKKKQLEKAKEDRQTELISKISDKIDELKRILYLSKTDEEDLMGRAPPMAGEGKAIDTFDDYLEPDDELDISYLEEDALIAEEETKALKLEREYEKNKEYVSKKTKERVKYEVDKVLLERQRKDKETAFDLFEKIQSKELKKNHAKRDY